MFDTYQEHLDHSAPCASRWDGFDRGDLGREEINGGERVIGRMTNEAGQRIEIFESWCEDESWFYVYVDDKCAHSTDDRTQAVTVARWWMAGCPA